MDNSYESMALDILGDAQNAQIKQAANKMCELARRYGKELTESDVKALFCARDEILKSVGRIEFGAGVVPYMTYALCDSPFIETDGLRAAICELMPVFYSLKNDCEDELTDEELIDALTGYFNACEGDICRTADAGFDDILRINRGGQE